MNAVERAAQVLWGIHEEAADCSHRPEHVRRLFIDANAAHRFAQALADAGLLVSDETHAVKPFVEAQIGDEAYTWENANRDWGGYRLETVDPLEWHDPDGLAEIAPVIRKKWRLIEVDEVTP